MYVEKAIENGRTYANEILEARQKAVARRKGSAPASAGVLIAEGDSWFDYPFCDILKVVEDSYGYDVESVAHRGDVIEDMAYTGKLEQFTARLEKLARNHVRPKAVLLSGGGNDIAGAAFGALLNHASSAQPGLNESVMQGIIDERLRDAYVTILSQITRLCEGTVGLKLPIIIHGYDYPVPDGRGFSGGFWFLPGPWLRPALRRKGYLDTLQALDFGRSLIDRFNRMLHGVVEVPAFAHVRFIDLRGTLSTGGDYKQWWANELHPTREGFELIARHFIRVLRDL